MIGMMVCYGSSRGKCVCATPGGVDDTIYARCICECLACVPRLLGRNAQSATRTSSLMIYTSRERYGRKTRRCNAVALHSIHAVDYCSATKCHRENLSVVGP